MWITPQRFARDADVHVQAKVRGRVLPGFSPRGLTIVAAGNDVLVRAVAQRERGPLRFDYVAMHRQRIRLIYWAE